MSIADKLTTIAENEQKVYDAGFEAGKSQGGDTDAAFEEGKQAQYDEFWDTFQNNGKLRNYKQVFSGRGWKSEVFYPKYNIIVTGAMGIFQEFGGTVPFSLTERLEKCGVTLDFSGLTSVMTNAFLGVIFTEIPHIDGSKVTGWSSTFQSSQFLETISIAIKEDGSATWSSTFGGCKALKSLTITSGTIGKNGFNVKDSTKLSKASILSILNACKKDVIGQGISITLPSKCIDGATDTETLMSETGDADLYGALMAARSYGYSVTFA